MFYTEHGFKIIIIVVAQSRGMAIISKSVFISVNDFERRLLLLRVRVIIVTHYYYTLFVANKNTLLRQLKHFMRVPIAYIDGGE